MIYFGQIYDICRTHIRQEYVHFTQPCTNSFSSSVLSGHVLSGLASHLRALFALVTLCDCRRRRGGLGTAGGRQTKEEKCEKLALPPTSLSLSSPLTTTSSSHKQVSRPPPLSISHPRKEVRIRAAKKRKEVEEGDETEKNSYRDEGSSGGHTVQTGMREM